MEVITTTPKFAIGTLVQNNRLGIFMVTKISIRDGKYFVHGRNNIGQLKAIEDMVHAL